MTKMLVKGRNPINQHFKGSHFHHMHINGNNTIGIYIPEKLHRKNNHCNWERNQESLNKINKEALLWLCEQSIIKGDVFNPTAEGTYMEIKTPNRGAKVPIASGNPSTKEKLRIFKCTHNINCSETKLQTLEDAVLFAIQGASKVPELEKKIQELEAENKKLKGGN